MSKSEGGQHRRATLITLACSALGLLSSFFASVYFSTSVFGWYTVMSSQVAFWTAVASLGFLGYFLGHIDAYRQQEKNLFFLPVVAALVVGLLYAVFSPALWVTLAFALFLLVSVIANAFVVQSQISKSPLRVAFFQGVPTLLKSLVVAGFLAVTLAKAWWPAAPEDQLFAIVFSLLSLVTLLLLLSASQRTFKGVARPPLALGFARDKNFYASWSGVVMAFSFATAIPSLVARKTNVETAAYFGIYMLFWSVSSTLSISLVTNRYGYQLAHAFNQRQPAEIVRILLESLKKTALIMLVVGGGVVFVALFLASHIWPKFADISTFLSVAAILLLLKCLQSWTGMLLALPRYVMVRTSVQLGCIVLFIAVLYLLQAPSVLTILLALIAAELLLTVVFMLYTLSSMKKIKRSELTG
ncbi:MULTISPECIES: hypothetical protein [unclassified Duganella]|uniref:hypothetical protein n=1 Tax=unclassified Duganella TaxID=2636909 RepID=UPI00088FDF1B|nr:MULTISPECIES: hypothetical protein [unclassified Duganella]SDH36355.1 hypothetical protein SAMN05216320_112147 [Duganella sp. OV458]SDK52702.1 hypothetical protein SAMN05428973_112147 [Duganella sp. OV510]